MRKVFAAALSLAAVVSVSSAKAATLAQAPLSYSFNLQSKTNKVPSGTSAGNAISATQTSGGANPLTLTATAWNATKSSSSAYTVKKATLGQYVGGLGVTSAYDDLPGRACGIGGCNTHQVDNFGNTARSSSIDFIRLDFSDAVTLSSITRTAYSAYNSTLTGVTYDDDFSYGKGGAIANNLVLNSSAFAALFGTNVGNAGKCTYKAAYGACYDTSTLTSADAVTAASASTSWFVAASLLANYGGDGNVDSFKLSGLSVYKYLPPITIPPIVTVPSPAPEPASWAMMVLGFGAAGGALRRRRAGTLRTA